MAYTTYEGKNVSARAAMAYMDGMRPAKEWKKAEMLAGITNKEILKRLRSMKVAELREIRLACKEWHHTTKSFKRTNFYELRPAAYVKGALFAYDFPQVFAAVAGMPLDYFDDACIARDYNDYAANDNDDAFVEGTVYDCGQNSEDEENGVWQVRVEAGGEHPTTVYKCTKPYEKGEKVCLKVKRAYYGIYKVLEEA